jgi:hypothetical protein
VFDSTVRRESVSTDVSATGCRLDPIAFAWKHCNPKVPVPEAVEPGATPSALAVGLSSIRHLYRPPPEVAP